MKKMKTKYFTKILFLALVVSIFSCDTDDESEILQDRDTAGAILNLSGSAKLLGAPADPSDLPNSEVAISDNELEINVSMVSGDLSNVDHFEIVKQFNNGEEVSEATFTEFPYTLMYDTFDAFTAGTPATSSTLRIGDVFKYTVKVHQNDGDVYAYSTQSFNVTVNCSSDLVGMYTMTNTVCASSEVVEITQNPDGSYNLSTVDGGLLQFCSSNSSLVNTGNITVVCGEILPSLDVTYCDGYGIGCITGGSWDQDAGVLSLSHTNDFFTWADAAYESTYTRL